MVSKKTPSMSDLDTLYDRNEGFTRTFDQGDLPILPRRPTIILTCVDARVDPAHFLGLELGDTLVLRNSGGRVTDDVEQERGPSLGHDPSGCQRSRTQAFPCHRASYRLRPGKDCLSRAATGPG